MFHVPDHADVAYTGELSQTTQYVVDRDRNKLAGAIRSGIRIACSEPHLQWKEIAAASNGGASRTFWQPVEDREIDRVPNTVAETALSEEAKTRAGDAVTRNCASCTNFTSKEYLADYLARACGNTYCGLCRLKSDPARGAFILKVQYHGNCRNWEAEGMRLAA